MFNTDNHIRNFDYTRYDRLHFIDPELKDNNWLADVMRYVDSGVSVPLVEEEKAIIYRAFERGERDEQKAKNIVDPPSSKDSGGNPQYFASNWSANPLFVHINNIADAILTKQTDDIVVHCTDKYAITKKQKENRRILDRDRFRLLINRYNSEIGLPLLSKKDDPFKYYEEQQMKFQKIQEKIQNGEDVSEKELGKFEEQPKSIDDYLKTLIEDEEDIAIYNEYIYKDDIAIPCELGIQYYCIQNNFTDIQNRMHKDMRHFNCFALRFYTSRINGEPILEYLRPEDVHTNQMQYDDCRDLEWVYVDRNITFGEFMRTIGASLDDTQLYNIFEANKSTNGYASSVNYKNCTATQREYSQIRLRYAEILTQNRYVYSESTINGNYKVKKAPFDFKIKKNSDYTKLEKNYNVWYYAYSIPDYPSGNGKTHFIIEGGKLQDQQRIGTDLRFSKSSFILYKRQEQVSWTDIQLEYMEEINPLWDKIKNDIRQAKPHGVIFNYDAIRTMLKTLDDGKRPEEAMVELLKQISQTGSGMLPEMNEDGKREYTNLYRDFKTGHIGSAMEKLQMLNGMYEQMKQALGINDAMEGASPQPRQALGGIKIATQASNNARHYLKQMKDNLLEEVGYRMVRHFSDIVDEGGERLKRFGEIVGYSNQMQLSTLKDIPIHRIGIYIEHKDEAELEAQINGIIMEMAKTGMIGMDEALFLTGVHNIKYKYALTRLERKKRERIASQQAQQQAQMAQEQFKMEILKEKELAKIRVMEYGEKKKIDLMVEIEKGKDKTANQIEIKDRTTEGRKEERTHEKILEERGAPAIEEEDEMSLQDIMPQGKDAFLPPTPQQDFGNANFNPQQPSPNEIENMPVENY